MCMSIEVLHTHWIALVAPTQFHFGLRNQEKYMAQNNVVSLMTACKQINTNTQAIRECQS